MMGKSGRRVRTTLAILRAVHPRHREIDQHEVRIDRVEDVETTFRILGQDDVEAEGLQRCGQEEAHVGIVVDHQDPGLVGPRRGRIGKSRFYLRGDLDEGQPQEDGRPARRVVLDPGGAAGLPRHRVDLAQAEPGALANALRSEEGLEGTGGDAGWHAGFRIGHADLDIPAGREFVTSRELRSAMATVSVPPSGMASRALMARFSSAISNWVRSAIAPMPVHPTSTIRRTRGQGPGRGL